MIQPQELLDFAFDLPINANHAEVHARRAISAAYYALFHLLTQAGAALVDTTPGIRRRIARSYDHAGLRRAAEQVERAAATGRLSDPLDVDLVAVARTLNRLREARERADYDLCWTVEWDEAEELMREAMAAFALFERIKHKSATVAFLLEPLLRDRNRRG